MPQPGCKAASEDGGEEILTPFRYNISGVAPGRTILFRPNAVTGEVKTASLGAMFAGHYDRLPSNKVIDVVWEVR